MTPTKLGRYRIVGELGHGAMGTVYRAVDPLIEREVAIKTLHPDLPPEVIADVRERFLREARSAGRLNHPNIVTIFDVGEEEGVAYMAMELLEGQSLQQMLREAERLSFQAVADLVAQIADALDRAQQLGIVHRDVKPANVVVSSTGHAKLTDFGVAYVPSSTMTQTGTMIGSPRYMSPEQVLGLPVDPRSDIFSLGVVLYEMLAGQAPFVRTGDTTIFPLMNRIAAEQHRPVVEHDSAIPKAFDLVLNRALAKKPDGRYQRAAEMASDLRNLHNLESLELKRAAAKPPEKSAAPIDDDATRVFTPAPKTDQKEDPAFEKTVVLPPVEQTAPPPQAAQPKPGVVLLDLDAAFSRDFEAEEKARLQAEEAARRKKMDELNRWGDSEASRREAFERKWEGRSESDAEQPETKSEAGSGARPSALDLLKKQKPAQPSAAEIAVKIAAGHVQLDRTMRDALKYIAEIARELSAVNPVSGRPYRYIYLGSLPEVTLSSGFADLGRIKIDGTDYANLVFFRFRIMPATPVKVTVLGEDIVRCSDFLNLRNVPHERKDEAKSDFGKVTRALFTVNAPLPCEVNIRADYEKRSIEIELVNVRHSGSVRCRIDPSLLEAVVDDLARYVLGIDDDFGRVLKLR